MYCLCFLQNYESQSRGRYCSSAFGSFDFKETEFLDKIQQSLAFTAKEDVLVSLGISPTRPDTGYGYINFHKNGNDDIHKIERFLEKPVLEKA